MPTPAPAVIADRYQLGAPLGRGGMGEVRDGMDLRLGRPVAVKVLRSDLAAEPEPRRRFEAEARAAAGLVHPNVVAVYDTGEHDGTPYIVMERLPGRTVADEIAEERMEPARAERLAREVLGALEAAHGAGVVHRDIKPGNLLLAADGSVKVADFGIAKAAEGLGLGAAATATATGEVLGTPAYVAPERLEGRPATARSDLYGLGVVLYEALSGVKPFSGETPWGLAQAVMAGRHQPLAEVAPHVPPALAAAVERAMSADPDDRFATAAEMAASLQGGEDAAATAPIADHTEKMAAPPARAAPGAGRLVRGTRRRAGVLAAAVGVAVLAVVGALAARDPEPREAGTPAPVPAPVPARALPEPLDRALTDLQRAVRP